MHSRRLIATAGAGLIATGAALLPVARGQAVAPATPITFAHEITVDPQRLGSEPDLTVSPYADNAIYTSSIWGFSNTQSFLYKSSDGGAQYGLIKVLPTGSQRPTTSQGGGDTEIQVGSPDQAGHAPAVYFYDLNNLSTLDCAYSYDGGATFTLAGPANTGAACNVAAGNTPGADRQWAAVYKQAGKADTVYMFYNDAEIGKFSLLKSVDAGQTYTTVNSAIGTNTFRPGPIQVDQNTGDIYTFISTLTGSNYGTAVEVSTDGGVTFTQHDILPAASQTTQSTSTDFVSGAVDTAGNVYSVWSTAAADTAHSTITYYSYSTDHGTTWAAPIPVTGPLSSAGTAVTSAEFPWITAGDPGHVDIAFYGSTAALPYDPGADTIPWDVYMAQATSYTNLTVTRASEHHTHVAPICNAGLGCTGTGDRNLGDFFEIQHDAAGRAVINFCDDNNSAIATVAGGCVTSSIKQASGPGLFTANPTISDPGATLLGQSLDVRSTITDPSGDASLGGAAVPAADITGVALTAKDAATMEVTINVADLSSPTSAIVNSTTGGAHTTATWMVSWHTATDVYFAACTIDASGTPTFYAGKPGNVPNAGAPKALVYTYQPANNTLITTGSSLDSAHNKIVLDVPLSTVGSPAATDLLYSVQGFTLDGVGAQVATAPLQDQIDATAPIDYLVSGPAANVPEAPWSALLIVAGVALLGVTAVRRRRSPVAI